MELTTLPDRFSICKLDPRAGIPAWATPGPFFSVTRTPDELSIVCLEENVPTTGIRVERGWRCLKVRGPLHFGLTGILASIAGPLAAAKISIFSLSTFDTDYLLVKAENLSQAMDALRVAGHAVVNHPSH